MDVSVGTGQGYRLLTCPVVNRTQLNYALGKTKGSRLKRQRRWQDEVANKETDWCRGTKTICRCFPTHNGKGNLQCERRKVEFCPFRLRNPPPKCCLYLRKVNHPAPTERCKIIAAKENGFFVGNCRPQERAENKSTTNPEVWDNCNVDTEPTTLAIAVDLPPWLYGALLVIVFSLAMVRHQLK
jgi:hypothetical protein